MNESFRRVQLRITLWYVAVFAGILLLFGSAVYLAVTRQIGRFLDQQLVAATDEIERAMEIREEERGVAGQAVDALLELRIPGRDLYVFDDQGQPVGPTLPPSFVESFARAALSQGEAWGRPESEDDTSWRLYGRRIEVGGRRYAALAVASAVEVEDQYAALLASFLLAALGALAVVALGGWALARKSLVPVEASMERMRRFVADASHELRTPAAVLRTRAEVALQRARTVEEYAEIMQKTKDEAERLGRIVDWLLLLAAADEDRLPLHWQKVFLDDILVQASELAHTLAASKGVTLELGAFEEAPADADPELVRQLFLILLENAVKYTLSPGTVRADVTTDAASCHVAVSDTGPGIPAEILPHVFERFYRADPSRKREGGSGLGLAIARSIADAHGAKIALDSVVGRGTTVRVSFPRRLAAIMVALAAGAAMLTAGPRAAAAQEVLTLTQALARAEATDPGLAAATSDSLAAAAGLSVARAFPNPALALSYTRDVPTYHLEAELPVDYPWLRSPRIRSARALAAAGSMGVGVARAQLRWRVEVTYGRAAGALELLRLSEQAVADGREMLRIAEAQEASGDASVLDVALARVALGELNGALLADSLAALDAVMSLQALLGMGQERVLVAPSDALADIPFPEAGEGGTPLRLGSADSLVASQSANLTLVRRSRLPSPALLFGFEGGVPPEEDKGLLPIVGVTIPLPLFDRGSAAVRQAEAALMRAQAERAAVQREVRSALEAARRSLDSARRRLAVDEAAVQDARRIEGLARDAYREGAYPLASVLEAQRSARDVLRRRIENLMAGREAAAAYRLSTIAGGMTP
jgi:signal transduction histidine kinase/outer membrane protein TolC